MLLDILRESRGRRLRWANYPRDIRISYLQQRLRLEPGNEAGPYKTEFKCGHFYPYLHKHNCQPSVVSCQENDRCPGISL